MKIWILCFNNGYIFLTLLENEEIRRKKQTFSLGIRNSRYFMRTLFSKKVSCWELQVHRWGWGEYHRFQWVEMGGNGSQNRKTEAFK